MLFRVFWVPGRGTAWRHTPGLQAMQSVLPIFWVADEAPGGTGWTARWRGVIWLILGFSGILGGIWSGQYSVVILIEW